MIKILFSNSGRRTYLIDYCFELIKKGYKLDIYASDTSYVTSSFFANQKVKKIITPEVQKKETKYVKKLLEVCKKEKINLLIPLIDTELKIISKKKKLFSDIGTTVLISSHKLILQLMNKKLTSKFCDKNKINYPKSFFSLKSFDNHFPVVKKKLEGSASKGMSILLKKEDLNNFDPDQEMLQKFVFGQEVGIDILNDFSGKYVHCCAKSKISMRDGETDKARIVNNKKYVTLSKKISKIFKHIGPLDVDLIEDKKGNIFFIDFNPRFGGGYPFSHLAGCNYLKAIIDMYQNKNYRRIKSPKKITAMKGISLFVSND